jgi:acyl carrier protein
VACHNPSAGTAFAAILAKEVTHNMEALTVSEQVRHFILQNYLLGKDFRLEDDQSFLDHGIIDSVGVLEFVAFLQERYGVKVEDEELLPENLDSINAVSAYLKRKLNGGAAVGEHAVSGNALRGSA